MSAYRELTSEDLKKLRSAGSRLSDCQTWSEIGVQSVEEMMRLIDANNSCHNHFTLDGSTLLEYFQVKEYEKTCADIYDAFTAHINDHPILTKWGINVLKERTCKMSDSISDRALLKNPLYQEAYRHIDAKYQLSRTVGHFENKSIILGINRSDKDFTTREQQLAEAYAHLLYQKLCVLQKRLHLNHCLDFLFATMSASFPLDGIREMTPTELAIFQAYLTGSNASEIANIRGVKTNTIHKQTQRICEKMGSTSIRKLVSSFRHQLSNE